MFYLKKHESECGEGVAQGAAEEQHIANHRKREREQRAAGMLDESEHNDDDNNGHNPSPRVMKSEVKKPRAGDLSAEQPQTEKRNTHYRHTDERHDRHRPTHSFNTDRDQYRGSDRYRDRRESDQHFDRRESRPNSSTQYDFLDIFYQLQHTKSHENGLQILKTIRGVVQDNISNILQFTSILLVKRIEQDHNLLNERDFVDCIKIFFQVISGYVHRISSARDISTILHRFGKLAESFEQTASRYLMPSITANTIETLFKKLLSVKPNARTISTSLWGIAKLVECKNLAVEYRLSRNDAEDCLRALHQETPDAQAIANCLWAIAKLAECGRLTQDYYLRRGDAEHLLNNLLRTYNKAQNIANSFTGLAKLAGSGHLSKNYTMSSSMAQNLLQALRATKPDAQNNANCLWALAKLVESDQLSKNYKMNLLEAQDLLQQLYRAKPTAQDIANSLWGLAKLAEYGRLAKEYYMSAQDAENWLRALQGTMPTGQSIANSLWALAKLAECGQLSTKYCMSCDDTKAWLFTLSRSINDAQHIAISLWALAKLAEGKLLAQAYCMSRDEVKFWLQALQQAKPKVQNVTNTLWALAKLAESDHLEQAYCVSSDDAERLLEPLRQTEANAQQIAISLWGLGKLAESRRLSKNYYMSQPVAEGLLQTLQTTKPSAQAIANSLWGLAKLAECDRLSKNYSMSPSIAKGLLQSLQQAVPDAQEIANSLLALAKLVQNGYLAAGYHLNQHTADYCLQTLLRTRPKAQHIANTLWALGKLVEKGRLSEHHTLSQPMAQTLLQALHANGANGQEIANSFWGLGKLAEGGRLASDYRLSHRDAEGWLEALYQAQPSAQNISNSLWALAKLQTKQHLHLDNVILSFLKPILLLLKNQTIKSADIYMISSSLAHLDLFHHDQDLLGVMVYFLKQLSAKIKFEPARYQGGNVITLVSCLSKYMLNIPAWQTVIDAANLKKILMRTLPYINSKRNSHVIMNLWKETLQRLNSLGDFTALIPKASASPAVSQSMVTEPYLEVFNGMMLPEIAAISAPKIYDIKNNHDVAELTDLLKQQSITFLWDGQVEKSRPRVSVAPIGLLNQQFGVYAGEDITVGRSGAKLLGEYRGEYFDELPESRENSHYIFDFKEGGIIDGQDQRSWTAFVNHAELYNVRAKSVRRNNKPTIEYHAIRNIRQGEPLYVDYGPNYFINLNFHPLYLGATDNWRTLSDIWAANQSSYMQQVFRIDASSARDLGLQPHRGYVVTTLFKAVFAADIDAIADCLQQIPSTGKGAEKTLYHFPPIALNTTGHGSEIADVTDQENITPFMLACYLGNVAVVESFIPYIKSQLLAKDYTVLAQRAWHSGKTALAFLLSGRATTAIKMQLFEQLFNSVKECCRSLQDRCHYLGLLDQMDYALVNKDKTTLISYCIEYNLTVVAKLILSLYRHTPIAFYEVMSDERGHKDLSDCISLGHFELLEILLKYMPKEIILQHIADETIDLSQCSLVNLQRASICLESHLQISQHVEANQQLQSTLAKKQADLPQAVSDPKSNYWIQKERDPRRGANLPGESQLSQRFTSRLNEDNFCQAARPTNAWTKTP